MTRLCLRTIVLALFASVVACGLGAAQKRQAGMLVATDWLARNANRVVLLHVATRREHYDAGHIPQAVFIAWSDITATRNGVPNEVAPIAQLQKVFTQAGAGNTKRIVIYGDLNGLAAARAFFTLDYLGHGERVALLDGGLEKWRAEKREVVTTSANPSPEEFTPRVNPRAVIELDAMRDVSWSAAHQKNAPLALIDARPAEEYSGAKPGADIPRPGHLPGAANVFWQNHFVSRDQLTLKPESELRKLYRAAGLSERRPVVVYCRTGVQAAHTYFTLRYLGYQVLMYDGSFFEWSKQPDTPVAL